jgi:hypothetical protein
VIDRQHGKIIFECDACGDVLETEQPDWATAKAIADREGWFYRKVGQDWVHGCADCGEPS